MEQQIVDSRPVVDDLYAAGSQHLTAMRRLVSATGNVDQRSVDFAEEAVSLVGVISAMAETSVAPAVQRAAEDMARTFVRPATQESLTDLADRQEAVIDSVADAVAQSSAALVAAANDILARERIEPFRFTPISSAEAVLLYAEDFVPSWAGAIAIDMMPAVLVLMLMIVHGAIRIEEGESALMDNLTLRELSLAASALNRLQIHAAPQADATRRHESRCPNRRRSPVDGSVRCGRGRGAAGVGSATGCRFVSR